VFYVSFRKFIYQELERDTKEIFKTMNPFMPLHECDRTHFITKEERYEDFTKQLENNFLNGRSPY
jgi:hypothetical protein